MQEPQNTSVNNTYYNLVSALYHALQSGQTSATYLRDAQQSGNQELAQFFNQVQQQANWQAQQAQQLIMRMSTQTSR